MSIPSVQDANYPAPSDVTNALLRAIRFAYARRGLVANVLPGSDHFIRAEKYASRVAIAIANNKLALADFNPLTATGDSLVIIASVFGVSKRPAGPAAGSVTIVCTGTITIPAAFQCTAPSGKKYKTVSISTSITTGTSVHVIALSGGADTNQDEGTQCTWDSAAIGALNPRCTVGEGGLTGGADEDNDEALRTRLLNQLAFPAGGGNASQTAEFAEESSASIEAAYVYQAVRGPASYDVAITKAGDDRTLPAATVAAIRNYVLSKMPGQQDLNLTTVSPQEIDVVLEAALPLPTTAGGAGGGWRDSAAWPAEATKVTAYDGTTGIATVNAVTAPTAHKSIGIWDPAAGVMREYTIAFAGGVSTAWTITVDGGFIVSPLGAYVSAGAFFLVDYATAFVEQMGALGPGEKTDVLELLPRAKRFPSTELQAPSNLTSRLLVPLQAAFTEIADIGYLISVDTGGTSPTDDRAEPEIPLTTADPPNILVLKHFAIVKLVP